MKVISSNVALVAGHHMEGFVHDFLLLTEHVHDAVVRLMLLFEFPVQSFLLSIEACLDPLVLFLLFFASVTNNFLNKFVEFIVGDLVILVFVEGLHDLINDFACLVVLLLHLHVLVSVIVHAIELVNLQSAMGVLSWSPVALVILKAQSNVMESRARLAEWLVLGTIGPAVAVVSWFRAFWFIICAVATVIITIIAAVWAVATMIITIIASVATVATMIIATIAAIATVVIVAAVFMVVWVIATVATVISAIAAVATIVVVAAILVVVWIVATIATIIGASATIATIIGAIATIATAIVIVASVLVVVWIIATVASVATIAIVASVVAIARVVAGIIPRGVC